MITSVLDHINNHFIGTGEFIELTFDSAAKTITGELGNTYIVGQYIYVCGKTIRHDGTILNMGVFKINTVTSSGDDIILTVNEDLQDETATAFIFGLAIPTNVISLVTRITTWITSTDNPNGLASERLDDYAASFGLAVQTGGFQAAFGGELSDNRKVKNDLEKWKHRCWYGY